MEHLAFDAAELQTFQRQVRLDGAVHPGAGEVPDAIFTFGRIAPLPSQGQVHIQRAQHLEEKATFDVIVNPVVFLIPVGGKARLAEDFRILRLALVSGQNHRGDVVAVIFANGLGCRYIRRELLRSLARFPAVVVAEGVTADLLPRRGGNLLQQRGAVKTGSIRLCFADFGEFRVRVQLFVDIARFFHREITADLVIVFRKQEANSGPGGVDAMLLKQLQKLRNRLSAAQNVILIGFQRTHIQHSPEQLKIQRNNQGSRHPYLPSPK